MRTSTIALFAASMATVLTLGCRGDDTGDDDTDDETDMDQPDGEQPDGDDPDGDASGEVSIYQVQGTEVSDNAPIQLDNVVVTAVDKYGMRTGTFFVQDPMGGEFSGVLVFGASPADVDPLRPGDVVRIEGAKKQEFTGPTTGPFQDGQSTTEVVPESTGSMTVTVIESGGAVPAPEVVDAQAIGAMPDFMDRNAEWEKWEGVLITVENVNALGVSECVGMACPDPDNTTTPITGDIDIQTSLAPLPTAAALGDCYASVTGVVDYFYDYHIYNTSEDAVVTGGTECELTNQVASIEEIQTGEVTDLVTIENAFVIARSSNNKNAWIATSLTGAPNQGVFVFRGNGTGVTELPADVAPGARVTVTGTVAEFNLGAGTDTVTQITDATITVTAAPAGAPVPATGQTAAALTVAATGEPYESVLVTLTNVQIVDSGSTDTMFWVGEARQNGTTFLLDDEAFRLPAGETGKCYASVTGFWTYQVFDDAYGFFPTGLGTGTGTCN